MSVETIDLIGRALGSEPVAADAFGRRITYLRVSVTDRCNLRCTYCMPEAGLPWIPKSAALGASEIERLVRAAVGIGVRGVRLTGGEPLIRPDLLEIVARLAAIDGLEDLSLSTNGLLLGGAARELARAGLRRVNVSLDTLRPERFAVIARRPGLSRVLAGIDAAIEAGLEPLKLNCVVMRGVNDDELLDFAELTRKRRIYVRFIEMMPVVENASDQSEQYVPAHELIARLDAVSPLLPAAGPPGNGPARYYAFPGAAGAVGVISPLSHDYCERCNRVRLTADGRLRTCLFGNAEIDLRTALRAGAGESELAALFRSALLIKPERHHLRLGEVSGRMRAFSEIGG